MKKIFLLASMFALLSCEQENLVGIVDNNAKVSTQFSINNRATNIADFDPITELDGIQVNIINMGTGSNKYLSCVEKGNQVDLCDKDDGSMRQRWYIGRTYIKLVGGNQTFAGTVAYVVPNDDVHEGASPILVNGLKVIGSPILACPFWGGDFEFINDDLVIKKKPIMNISSYNEIQYFQPETSNSSRLKYKKGNNDMSTHWRLNLVGDYEFEKIQYVKSTGDYVGLQAPMLRQYEYYNLGKPEPGEATFQINETVEYTSSFSESKTVSISNKVSVSSHIGTPTAGASGNISTETTTTYGWGFTTSETEKKSISITDTYKYIVPANKDIQMNVYIASYDMTVTYVMTVRRKHDGKLFRVKGKWTGVQGTNIKYQAVDLRSGEVLSQESRNLSGAPKY